MATYRKTTDSADEWSNPLSPFYAPAGQSQSNPQFTVGATNPELGGYGAYYPYTTSDPLQAFEQNRIAAGSWGNQMERDLANAQNQYGALETGARDQLYYGPGGYSNILAGGGGYTDAEMQNMLQTDLIGGSMATNAELQDLGYLTPGEQAAQLGTPFLGADTFRSGLGDVYAAQSQGNAAVRSAYGTLGSDVQKNISQAGDASRGAVNTMQGAYDAAIDPSQLGLSSDFNQSYNFSPADEQAMRYAAMRTVGVQSQADRDAMERAAAAAGNASPLALASAMNRRAYGGDIAAADAATQAAIQARQLGLSTTATKEQMRLGAAQDLSSRQMNAAQNVGTARLSNEQLQGTQALNANLTANQAALAAEQGLGAQGLATSQWALAGQTAANTAAEQSQADRQANLNATNTANLQNMLNTRNQQGTAAGQYYGNVYANSANLNQSLAQQGREFLTQQQQAAQEGRTTSAQQRISAQGTTQSGLNAGAQGQLQSKYLPSKWSAVGNYAGGVLQGYGG